MNKDYKSGYQGAIKDCVKVLKNALPHDITLQLILERMQYLFEQSKKN